MPSSKMKGGQRNAEALAVPFPKERSHPAALVKDNRALSRPLFMPLYEFKMSKRSSSESLPGTSEGESTVCIFGPGIKQHPLDSPGTIL